MIRRLLVALAALAMFVACTPTKPPAPEAGRPVFFGDSLLEQARPWIDWDARGAPDVRAYGGTALCDWQDKIVLESAVSHPRVIVVSFVGNAVTPCIADGEGPDHVRENYAASMAYIKARTPGQAYLWVVQPVLRTTGEPVVNDLYRAEPCWVDAGAVVEFPDGTFNPLFRTADGVHLNETGARRFADAIDGGVAHG